MTGKLVAISTIARDISERKQAQAALQYSEEKFSTIFRRSPTALILSSMEDNRFIDVNESFELLCGWQRAETIGRTPFDLSMWIEPGERVHFLDRVLAEGSVRDYEVRFRRKDGKERIALVSSQSVEVENETCVLSVIIDITSRKDAERALQSREDLLRIFVQHVPAAVAMLDNEMRYLQVSDRWCADFSLNSSELLGRSHYEIFPDLPDQWKQIHRRCLAGETLRADEDRWDRKDGTQWSSWEIRPWRNVEGVQGGILIFSEEVTRRKQMEERLSTVNRDLIGALEQERSRIGRELHDDINQRLAMLVLGLEDLRDHPAEVQGRAEELRQETIGISEDVQALSHEFHSSKLEYLGVVAGINSWCREFSERQKMEIEFQSDVTSVLPHEVGLCLFRVLQEALHNAVKHSGTRQIKVQLEEQLKEVDLFIHDSGGGFDVEAAKQGRGLGLTSMQERVKLVSGTILFESNPIGGTTICVRVPFESKRS